MDSGARWRVRSICVCRAPMRKASFGIAVIATAIIMFLVVQDRQHGYPRMGAVARLVTRRPPTVDKTPLREAMCSGAPDATGFTDPAMASVWNVWGGNTLNTRYQKDAGFTAAEVPRLRVKWAFGF